MPNDFLNQVWTWIKSNKTQTTAIVSAAVIVYTGYTGHDLPAYIYLALATLGFSFTRMGVKADVTKAVADIKAQSNGTN